MADKTKDDLIFGKKTLEDIYKEIYENSKNKEKQISTLIQQLEPLVTSTGEATLIVPLIKEYLGVGVKNDENLIKLATLLQKSNISNDKNSDFVMSEEEKKQLLEVAKSIEGPKNV